MEKDKHLVIKEDICDALEGKRKVRCPKCKSTKFVKTWCEEVEINIMPDYTEDDYLEEVEDEKYECRNCGRRLKEEEIK